MFRSSVKFLSRFFSSNRSKTSIFEVFSGRTIQQFCFALKIRIFLETFFHPRCNTDKFESVAIVSWACVFFLLSFEMEHFRGRFGKKLGTTLFYSSDASFSGYFFRLDSNAKFWQVEESSNHQSNLRLVFFSGSHSKMSINFVLLFWFEFFWVLSFRYTLIHRSDEFERVVNCSSLGSLFFRQSLENEQYAPQNRTNIFLFVIYHP